MIDVLTLDIPSECRIGDECVGEVTLKNTTDSTLFGSINIEMEGAVPVPPESYSLQPYETITVQFIIPTVGLTITGMYVLELQMTVGDKIVVDTETARINIISATDYAVTFSSVPETAVVSVVEAT